MYVSLNSYYKPQFSSKSECSKAASEKMMTVISGSGNNITDAALFALKENLRALKAKIGYEIAHSISAALKGKSNISERADSKLLNVNAAVDKCISEIVSEETLQSNPKLRSQVLTMKADTLQDIVSMLTFKR